LLFKKLEEIEAWKRGCRLAVEVYQFAGKDPLAKNWGLRDQIQRAAISTSSNIAEDTNETRLPGSGGFCSLQRDLVAS